MKALCLLVLFMVFMVCQGQMHDDQYDDSIFAPLAGVLTSLYDKYEDMKKVATSLSRQVMLQQFFVEERIRSEGDSGIKLTRGDTPGFKNYDSNTHISRGVASIHDHPNYDRTIGMGEVIAVINGVEFRTRHNDYKLLMPSTTSTEYHATEPVPFPGVPPEVTELDTVEDQMAEMQEWFRAFKNQDPSVRDYRQYFKPILCYMEGAWTLDKSITEPFDSDRHQLDADSWFDLQEEVRLTSYVGTKSRVENYAYLPTTVMSVDEETGMPMYAQWNYRILCYPAKKDIPFEFLRQVDDLAARTSLGISLEQMLETRGARFKLYEGKRGKWELLDEIFYTVPGWNNLYNDSSDLPLSDGFYHVAESHQPINTGYYNRVFKFSKPDAMGSTTVARGFNDANMWVAQTTQPRVAGLVHEECRLLRVNGRKMTVCENQEIKYTYAIPLEIVYLTPLLTWNPYNLTVHEETGIASADGRNGGNSKADAYNGTDRVRYFLTPAEFYLGDRGSNDPADTSRNSVGVLDQEGVVRKVTTSGTMIILRTIGGNGTNVGPVRLRYPIAPVHGEGSSVWKELNALKDHVAVSVSVKSSVQTPRRIVFQLYRAFTTPPGDHMHNFDLSHEECKDLIAGRNINVTTTEDQGHTHDLEMTYISKQREFRYVRCDNRKLCSHDHPPFVYALMDEEEFNMMMA